jgi:hypothetical protein
VDKGGTGGLKDEHDEPTQNVKRAAEAAFRTSELGTRSTGAGSVFSAILHTVLSVPFLVLQQ